MFTSFYAITKDRKGGIHQYRLGTGEGVPRGQEIVDLKIAGVYPFGSLVDDEKIEKMYAVAALSDKPAKRRKRATKE